MFICFFVVGESHVVASYAAVDIGVKNREGVTSLKVLLTR